MGTTGSDDGPDDATAAQGAEPVVPLELDELDEGTADDIRDSSSDDGIHCLPERTRMLLKWRVLFGEKRRLTNSN